MGKIHGAYSISNFTALKWPYLFKSEEKKLCSNHAKKLLALLQDNVKRKFHGHVVTFPIRLYSTMKYL